MWRVIAVGSAINTRYSDDQSGKASAIRVPDGRTVTEELPAVAAVFDAVREQVPQLRVVDFASTGDDAFVSEDGRTTVALVQGPLPAGFGPGAETQLTAFPTSCC